MQDRLRQLTTDVPIAFDKTHRISEVTLIFKIVRRGDRGFWLPIAGLLLSACISSCGASTEDPPSVAADQPVAVQQERGTCTSPALLELWQERDSNNIADFPVGPGDVIMVSVPEIDEIQKQQIRVAPDGTIGLPLIGTMEVAGMTENDLRSAISQKLSVYMKFPRVELFVERYQARDVAVVGAVQKPGLYDLANSDQSIIDVIGIAGGMTTEAAQKVIFVPPKYGHGFSSSAQTTTPADVESATQVSMDPNNHEASFSPQSSGEIPSSPYLEIPSKTPPQIPSGTGMKSRTWIVLDLAKPGAQACLDFPTRPGDVVMIPIAGQVMVQGWVQNPGAFKITPGMTILGAISAAGGTTYSWTAELLRTGADGRQTATEFSLSQLAKGEGSDVPVQSGDVVVVERSAIGAVPYTLFQLFQRFGAGLAFPIP